MDTTEALLQTPYDPPALEKVSLEKSLGGTTDGTVLPNRPT